MQLISLTANRSTFRPVIFRNEVGLNFIVAKQSQVEKDDQTKSFNGVGKSLLIAIIHFCLGSSKKESFKDHLPGWIFTLRLKINADQFVLSRSVDNQGVISVNGEEIKIGKFNKDFEMRIFDIPQDVDQLSFRSLLPFFIRPKRESYSAFNNPNNLGNAYQVLITNAFLLGLDVHLVRQKYTLRVEKERIKNLVKELTNDHLLKEFFVGNRDVSIATQDLQDQISKLELDLKEFNVAEDYYEIKKESDKIKKEIEAIQNFIFLQQKQIENIDESLKISPDLSREHIKRIYEEASVVLSDQILKTLTDLETFYEHLTTSRQKRLLDQKSEIQRQLEVSRQSFAKLKSQFDKNLKYLDTHQALDVFVRLTTKLSDLKSEKESIEKYNQLLREYNIAKVKVEKEFLEATATTYTYLEEAEPVIKQTKEFFRELAKRFYPNSAAGITVYNNDGDNQIRYELDAKIEADASDGINSVKIFCYDLTILIRGYGHRLNVIVHDSRLVDGIDPRQIAVLFRVLNEYIKSNNKQYILTINQNDLDDIRPYLSESEFRSIISENICHELKDDSVENKLLGIQVDMEYN
jgi:uncharacterized protein YydD (DUF2326 family)